MSLSCCVFIILQATIVAAITRTVGAAAATAMEALTHAADTTAPSKQGEATTALPPTTREDTTRYAPSSLTFKR